MRSIVKVFFALLVFITVERFCHSQTNGFQVVKVLSGKPLPSSFSSPTPSIEELPQIRQVLSQPFTFFSFGGQSYVFLSQDGKTVLKLFKQHHLSAPNWLRKIPLPHKWSKLRSHFLNKKKKARTTFFESCKIAYQEFPERSGLLYLHLTPTTYLHKKIQIVDKLKILHELDADGISFALQHVAEMPYQHFRRLKKEGNLTSAQESIDSLLDLITLRCKKGIRDTDPCIRRNCGFLKNTAIDIDLGSYIHDDTVQLSFVTQTELYYRTLKLKQWLQTEYPELIPYFERQLYDKTHFCPHPFPPQHH